MSAEDEFNKALRYLDFGKFEKGEICLINAIKLGEVENDELTLIQACCCYGDYLCSAGRKMEAKPFLNRVVSFKSDTDVLAYEINRAKDLMLELKD